MRPMGRVSAAMVAAGRVLGEPRLSPDGDRVAFVATAAGRSALVVVPATGGPELVLTTDPAPSSARADGGGVFDWLPDGTGLVYAATDGGLWLQPAVGGPPDPVVPPGRAGPLAAPAVEPRRHPGRLRRRPARRVRGAARAAASRPVRLTEGADFAFDPAWIADGVGGGVARVGRAGHAVGRQPDRAPAGRRSAPRPGGRRRPRRRREPAPVRSRRPARLPLRRRWRVARTCGSPRPTDRRAHRSSRQPTEPGGPSWGQGVRTWCWSPDGREVAWRTNEDGFSRVLRGDRHREPEVSPGPCTTACRGAARRWPPCAPVPAPPTRSSPTTSPGRPRRRGGPLARGPVAGWEALDLPEPEVLRWPGDDGGEVVGRLSLPRRRRPPAAAVLDPRRPHRPVAGHVQRPPRLLRRAGLGDPRARPPRLHRPRPGLHPGDGRPLGRARRRRLRRRHPPRPSPAGWPTPAASSPWARPPAGSRRCCCSPATPGSAPPASPSRRSPTSSTWPQRSHRFEAHYTHTLRRAAPRGAGRARRAVAARTSPPRDRRAGAAAPRRRRPRRARSSRPGPSPRCSRTLGRHVELHVYEGEGHGWGRPDVVVDELTRIEAFLARHGLAGGPPVSAAHRP